MKFKINYKNIPELSVCFTQAQTPFAKVIRLVRGGVSAVRDKAFANHSFMVTSDRGQLFAVEQTKEGLKENSMEIFRSDRNRIVACYYWTGFDNTYTKNWALDHLAYLRRKQGDKTTKVGKYNFIGLMRFLPVIGKMKMFNKDSDADWCSETCARIMQSCGATWIKDPEVAPDQLLSLMANDASCRCVLGYYHY